MKFVKVVMDERFNVGCGEVGVNGYGVYDRVGCGVVDVDDGHGL